MIDFLTFLDCSERELLALLDLADGMRDAFHARRMPRRLTGRRIAFVWDASGFRNRVAFEIGIAEMGGIAVQVPCALDERESVEDVAGYLDNWFDAIVARTARHGQMKRLAEAARVPVINARTDYNHPCEVLGDLAYIRTRRKRLEGLRVAFVGEASNICHPWLEAAARLPIRVVQICPEGYEVKEPALAELRRGAVGELSVTHDMSEGLRGAEVIITDCWPPAKEGDDRRRTENLFSPYRITTERLSEAASRVLFIPCPPVHRGEEVTSDAMESPSCRVREAKEYLLHAQNAVLDTLLGERAGP